MTTRPYTLITGASEGIGRELAINAAKDGHNVVLVARKEEKLRDLAQKIERTYSVRTEVLAVDLSEPGSPEAIFRTLSTKSIAVDILINNAGFGDYGAFVSSSLTKQRAMIDLNVRALTELCHLFIPAMEQSGHGYVLNLGSVASFLPGPMMSVYFASKAYVLSFSEALHEELRGSGVSVTCLCPGSTRTQFADAAQVKTGHSTRTSKVTPADVAAFGWKAMLEGKAVAIHGVTNTAAVRASRFLPKNVVARLVKRYQ